MNYHVYLNSDFVGYSKLSVDRRFLAKLLNYLDCNFQTEYKLGIL